MNLPNLGGYLEAMYTLCALCGGPGTQRDGPGAPCRACIRVAVASLNEVPVGSLPKRTPDAIPPGPAASRVAALPIEVAGHQPHHVRTPAAPSCLERKPMALTVVERTLVRMAMALPGRASDITLLGVLPVLAVEVAIRTAARISVESLTARVGSPAAGLEFRRLARRVLGGEAFAEQRPEHPPAIPKGVQVGVAVAPG